jgi:ubiquitin carboxyl-terminal hydrolase 34
MAKEDDEYIYRLAGVNIHRGNADHGHYWSLINTDRGEKETDPYVDEAKWNNVEKNSWRKFDDEQTTMFTFSDLKGDAFGGDLSSLTSAETEMFIADKGSSYGKSAYMLVYERKKKNDLRIVEVPEAAEKEGAEDEKMEEIKTEEVITRVPWREANPSVPDWVKDLVKDDNVEFVIDKQVFHEQFFKLISLVLKHIAQELCMTSHLYHISYYGHF